MNVQHAEAEREWDLEIGAQFWTWWWFTGAPWASSMTTLVGFLFYKIGKIIRLTLQNVINIKGNICKWVWLIINKWYHCYSMTAFQKHLERGLQWKGPLYHIHLHFNSLLYLLVISVTPCNPCLGAASTTFSSLTQMHQSLGWLTWLRQSLLSLYNSGAVL